MAKMTDDSLRDFVRERDDALLSMNDRKLAAYMAKYRVHIPTSEAGYWLGLAMAVQSMDESTPLKRRLIASIYYETRALRAIEKEEANAADRC